MERPVPGTIRSAIVGSSDSNVTPSEKSRSSTPMITLFFSIALWMMPRLTCFSLFFLDLNAMAVGVPHPKRLAEPKLINLILDEAGIHKADLRGDQVVSSAIGTPVYQNGLSVDNVIRMLVWRERASVTRSQIFQQLNPRTACSTQSSNTQMGAKHVVEMFLLCSVVLTLSGHVHAK